MRGHELFARQSAGVIVGALGALFNYDVALCLDIAFGQAQILHSVTFHFHHQRQAICRNSLEIGGVIVAGKGVVGPTIRRDGRRELAGGQFVRAFEQKVFQKMCNARLTNLFIRRSGSIPDHLHHNGGTVIFDHDYLHPVIKGKSGDVIADANRCGYGDSLVALHKGPGIISAGG